MEPADAYRQRDTVQFLDVREFYEYDAGHIEGALHIPIRHLKERFGILSKNHPVIVLCQIGQRSDLAAAFLRDQGYDAHNLEGGVTLWAEQGLPLIAGEGVDGKVVDG